MLWLLPPFDPCPWTLFYCRVFGCLHNNMDLGAAFPAPQSKSHDNAPAPSLNHLEENRCRASFCRASVVQSVCHSSTTRFFAPKPPFQVVKLPPAASCKKSSSSLLLFSDHRDASTLKEMRRSKRSNFGQHPNYPGEAGEKVCKYAKKSDCNADEESVSIDQSSAAVPSAAAAAVIGEVNITSAASSSSSSSSRKWCS